MDFEKIMPYYGYTLEDLKKKGVLEDYKVVWPHVHTEYSMGTLPRYLGRGRFNECTIEISKLLEIADEQGISEILVTDHDEPRRKKYDTHYSPIEGAVNAEEMAEKKHKVKVIPGQEVLFTQDKPKMEVHILLFPLREELDNELKTGSIENLAKHCEKNHIKMVAPHPLANESMKVGVKTLLYDPNIPKKIYNDNMKYFDAVSVINAFSPEKLNMITMHVTQNLDNVAKIGECDAHSSETLGLAGTLIPKNCSGLIKAIEDRTTIPFGALGSDLNLIYKYWAMNAYDLLIKYIYYFENEPYDDHGDGFEVFKQIHGKKFEENKALVYFALDLVKVIKVFSFPIAKYKYICMEHKLRRMINKILSKEDNR